MNFDIDTIRNVRIELLDCQVEIVLKSLEYYCYSANFLYERHGKFTKKDDELKISLITDTYHQIMHQLANSKVNDKTTNNLVNSKKIKKVS